MTDRTTRDRLTDNIDLMDGLSEGKGKRFILPETAREIRDDLRDLDRRIQEDKPCRACGTRGATQGGYCGEHA